MKTWHQALLVFGIVLSACRGPGFVETPAAPEVEATQPEVIPSQAAPPARPTVTPSRRATDRPAPSATVSATATPVSWQWLPYDPTAWRAMDVQNLELIADPDCKVWFDYGSGYPFDLRVRKTAVEIAGHAWEQWTFVNPRGTAVAEHYGPDFGRFFGWYNIPATELCRQRLLELLEGFPWDPSLAPLWPPTETLRFTLSAQEALKTTEHARTLQANATQQMATITQLEATSLAGATETILARTPPAPYEACAGTVLSRLRKGMRAYVSTDTPYPNALRQSPTKGTALLGEIDPGTVIELIDGPQCADGLIWWQVRLAGGEEGWTAEGDEDSYWLTPCPIEGVCRVEGG